MTLSLAIPGEQVANPFTMPSPKLWGTGFTGLGKGFPSGNIHEYPEQKIGVDIWEDFTDFPLLATNTSGVVKGWNYFLSNGGLIADAAIANLNAVTLSSDGDDEAAVLAKCIASIRITANSLRPVYFETRVNFSTIADTNFGAFMGLFEPITPSVTSHLDVTLPDKNFIGFWRDETDGDDLKFTFKRNGQTQQTTTVMPATLLAATWYKLGFAFDGVNTLKVFIDGQEYVAARLGATDLAAVTFPSLINLAPAVALQNATGSSPGNLSVNWIRFGYSNQAADQYRTAPTT